MGWNWVNREITSLGASLLCPSRDGTEPPKCRAGQPRADSRKGCFIRRSQTRGRLLQTQCDVREPGQLSQRSVLGRQRQPTKRRERAWLEPGSRKPQPVLPAHPGSLLQARRPLSPACKVPSLNISQNRKLTSKPGVSQSQGEQPTAASTSRLRFVSPAGLGPISFKTETHLPDVQSIEGGQRSPDAGSRGGDARGGDRI